MVSTKSQRFATLASALDSLILGLNAAIRNKEGYQEKFGEGNQGWSGGGTGREGGRRQSTRKAAAARGYVREGAWLRAASNQLSAARTASSVSSLMKSKNLGAENSYASSIAAAVPVSGAMGVCGIAA